MLAVLTPGAKTVESLSKSLSGAGSETSGNMESHWGIWCPVCALPLKACSTYNTTLKRRAVILLLNDSSKGCVECQTMQIEVYSHQ